MRKACRQTDDFSALYGRLYFGGIYFRREKAKQNNQK